MCARLPWTFFFERFRNGKASEAIKNRICIVCALVSCFPVVRPMHSLTFSVVMEECVCVANYIKHNACSRHCIAFRHETLTCDMCWARNTFIIGIAVRCEVNTLSALSMRLFLFFALFEKQLKRYLVFFFSKERLELFCKQTSLIWSPFLISFVAQKLLTEFEPEARCSFWWRLSVVISRFDSLVKFQRQSCWRNQVSRNRAANIAD